MSRHKLLGALGAGLVGYWLYQEMKKGPGLLSGEAEVMGAKVKINPDKFVDSAMPWMGLENPLHKELVRTGLKGLLKGKKS